MPKHNKLTIIKKVLIKYSIIIFALAIMFSGFFLLKPTYMRYRFEVTTDVIGYAKTTRNSAYTVTFDNNGGTGTMTDQPIQYGVSTALKPNEFTKTDYSFLKWNTEPDGSGTSYYDEDEITNTTLTTITLYAQWTQGVAEMDGQIFNTLQGAIEAVTDSTQKTIRLLKNTSENLTIPSGRNLIINLQHHTVSDPGSKAVVTNKGTLTLKNGTISSSTTTDGAINNEQGAHLTFENVTSEMTISGGKQALYNNKGTVYIKGDSHFTSPSTLRAAAQNLAGSIMYVESGTIISTSNNQPGLKNDGTLTIGVKNDGATSDTSPLIMGNTYGLETGSAFNFYDGIIKGKTEWTNNKTKLGEVETGYILRESQETIGSNTYKTAYLERAKKVTFDVNSEHASIDETVKYVESGQPIGTWPIPTRVAYSFDGWFTDPDDGTQISASTIITDDITFYAHWTKTGLIVTFDVNDDDATVDEPERTVERNHAIGTLPIPTKLAYAFDGWFTDPDNGTQISDSTIITDDITFFAHWTRTGVAIMNGRSYTTIQAAVTASTDNTHTIIKVLESRSEAINVTSRKNVEFDLQGFTISNNGDAAVITNHGTVKITNGTLTGNGETKATIDNKPTGKLYISGGQLISTGTRSSVYNEGTLEISGSAYLESTATGIPNNIKLERATVSTLSGSTTTITGGTIVGINQQAVSNEGTLTLGTKDGNISTTSPEIRGNTYGLRSHSTATFNYYDGIIKGKTNPPLDATITDQEDNTQIADDTETIGGYTYYTEYLESTQ